MLSLPLPQDDSLITEIMNDLDFFTVGHMLYFERSQIFQTDVVLTHPAATNRRPIGFYDNAQPTYDPGNLTPQNIVREGQVANPHELNLRQFRNHTNNVFFCYLYTSEPIWFISLPTIYLLYFPDSEKTDYIKKGLTMTIRSNRLVATDETTTQKFPIKVFSDENKEANFNNIKDVLTTGIPKKPTKTFELFFKSIQANGGFPPNKSMITSLYRSIVEDVQFLFLFSITNFAKSNDPKVVSSWLEAAGHNIITLFPFMIYHNFTNTKDQTVSMRSTSFITSIFIKIIEKDRGFNDFINSINMSADDLGEEFLSKFEKASFQPLTLFVLHHVFQEGRRRFPGGNAQYYAISNLLFVKTASQKLIERNKNISTKVSALTPLFNMAESRVGIEKVKRVHDLLDAFEAFPDGFGMLMSAPTSRGAIDSLLGAVKEEVQKFIDVATSTDLGALAAEYSKKATGKDLPEDNWKAAKPSGRHRRSSTEFVEPDEYSDMKSDIDESD